LLEGKIKGISLEDIQNGKYFEDRELYKEAQKMSSFWYKSFDDMALKTMLRQLISKWGIMSVDMQTAFEADDHEIADDLTPQEPIDIIPEEVAQPDGQGETENPEKQQGNTSKSGKAGQQKLDEV
jgi:recombinational DNA repair protein RecT